MQPRFVRVLGGCGLLVVSVLYCLPGHPSVHLPGWHAALHVLLFGVLAGLGCWCLHKDWSFVLMAGLGLGLEVVQWRVGGYVRLELPDVLANEAGVTLALVLHRVWRRQAGS